MSQVKKLRHGMHKELAKCHKANKLQKQDSEVSISVPESVLLTLLGNAGLTRHYIQLLVTERKYKSDLR